MRPHVELIHEDDYIWHAAELPRGDGKARQRNLSLDEEDGSASLRVDFDTAWERMGGYHVADTEWFVLEGQVAVGDTVLGKGGYVHAPKGVVVPTMRAKAGTRILLYREFGDWGFEPSDTNADFAREPLTVLDTEAIDWLAVDKPGPKPGSKQQAKAKPARAAKYRDESGNTWVGRGPRPQWLRDALNAGKSLQDFAV